VAFSPGNRTVATIAAQDGTLTVADTTRPARTTTLTVQPAEERATNLMAFSPDGRTLAVITSPTTLTLWDVADRAHPAPLGGLSGASFGSALAFSPDGRTLATAGEDDSTVTLWNVADRSAPVRLATLVGHSASVSSLAFSPDGHTLASGSLDYTAALWDVTDRAHPLRLATLAGHSSWVQAVAFSPDGHTLAVAGALDYAVILWDTSNPAGPIRLATVKTSFGALVDTVAFRDASTLAVTSQRQESGAAAAVTLWSYDNLNSLRADPARYACAVTGRGLTADEWARYIPEIPYRRTCPA
jgi:WD40 repeat protein